MSTISNPIVMGLELDPETHIYKFCGVEKRSCTQVLSDAGYCDFSFVEEEKRIHSMRRGTSVHWLTRLMDEGALNYRQVPRSLRPYKKAWSTFLKRTGFVPMRVEWSFYSPFGFAGTIDRFGRIQNTWAIVDIKTGADIPDWVRYQLCGYTLGIDHRPSIARTIRRIACRLNADETYNVKEFPRQDWDTDFSRFIKAVREGKHGDNSDDRAANGAGLETGSVDRYRSSASGQNR